MKLSGMPTLKRLVDANCIVIKRAGGVSTKLDFAPTGVYKLKQIDDSIHTAAAIVLPTRR
ncbi:MAG: hypothetical protein JWR26_1841 [Pedosphaera sp.]|nr:hypothetical protein [Pedosphaera sp.]